MKSDTISRKALLETIDQVLVLASNANLREALREMIKHFPEADVPAYSMGDTVYQTDGIRVYEHTVRKIIYDAGNLCFNEDAIGHSVWADREECEKYIGGLSND